MNGDNGDMKNPTISHRVADPHNRVVPVVEVNDDDKIIGELKQTDIQKFDILLCIGNKVDLLPRHLAHAEYRRCLLKHEESCGSSRSDLADHGISETEGSSLLGDEESSPEITKSCLEWCIEHIIEYIEACASNSDFDKCLSIDGDSQGVERLYGALSAHMWPRMSLKSRDKIIEPSLPEQEDGPVSTTGTWKPSPSDLDLKNLDRKGEVRMSDLLEKSTGLQHRHLSCRKSLTGMKHLSNTRGR
ncbi:uncharacterized protein Fot_04031 [Forsythia ovata]|uniref:Uncharacterized protein n=1 Tax=Forsythia ovata TaxID=205694 RepID=A0ABD1XBX7_9LAMI